MGCPVFRANRSARVVSRESKAWSSAPSALLMAGMALRCATLPAPNTPHFKLIVSNLLCFVVLSQVPLLARFQTSLAVCGFSAGEPSSEIV